LFLWIPKYLLYVEPCFVWDFKNISDEKLVLTTVQPVGQNSFNIRIVDYLVVIFLVFMNFTTPKLLFQLNSSGNIQFYVEQKYFIRQVNRIHTFFTRCFII